MLRIDEHNRVHIGVNAHNLNSFQLKTELLTNRKVTGSAIQEAERLEGSPNASRQAKGRAMSLMECAALVLGYSQVYTTIHFLCTFLQYQ